MNPRRHRSAFAVLVILIIGGCASGPDHFYRLQPVPSEAPDARHQFVAEVSIRLTVPSMVDRSQMVLEQGKNGVLVLEHERWATPLADQLHAVLGQDIEYRRPDVLVTSRPASQSNGVPRYSVDVQIVTLTLQKSGGVQMEVRWRVIQPGNDAAETGRQLFSAQSQEATPSALAQGVSDCLSQLAERLAPLLGRTA